MNLPKRRSIWSRRHKHEKQQKFAIKAKEAFETLKDRLAKAESMQKASMVVESQNKCLADELNEYIEQILERETSIVVERTAALHAEELARVRLESKASASHAGEKKLQEMSTLHSVELTKLREELHFMSSERVQAEALHAAEREALERERGEAGTEIARAREAHANIYRNESLEAENDAAREGLMRRIAELERFRADLTSLLRAEERDNDSNRAIAAALRSDASSRAATVARLEGSVEELNDSIAQMITQFKVQFSTLTEEKDQLAMKLDDEDQCKECVVCKELRKEYAFLPCGHMCVCKGCAASIQGQDRTCPLCQHVDHENLPLI